MVGSDAQVCTAGGGKVCLAGGGQVCLAGVLSRCSGDVCSAVSSASLWTNWAHPSSTQKVLSDKS